jgi:hypothetical protein
MVIRVGKPDNETDKEKTEKINNRFKSIWKTLLVIMVIFVLLGFLVVSLPGRYKAVVISEGDEVLLLDTVKGNIWCYRGNTEFAIITYQGKLRAGEKVPERLFIKSKE